MKKHSLIEKLFLERKHLIDQVLQNINTVQNGIAGNILPDFIFTETDELSVDPVSQNRNQSKIVIKNENLNKTVELLGMSSLSLKMDSADNEIMSINDSFKN
jgi:hypothetical protein